MNYCNIFLLLSFSTLTFSQKCENENKDIVFLLDCSTSIQENSPSNEPSLNWNLLKDFLIEVIKLLPISPTNTKSSVMPFSSYVHAKNEVLFQDKQQLINHVTNLPFYGGNTNTSGALRHARNMLDSSNKPCIVLVTDGFSNVDSSLTLQEARVNKQSSITQFAVGVGIFVDENELDDLVTSPASHYYLQASNFSSIHLLVDSLIHKLTCAQPPLPEPCRDSRADIMFVLDASGSILQDKNVPQSNWFFMKQFFADVARKLNIGKNETRIGLIKFSHIAEIVFYMDKYDDVDELAENILNIEIIGSETNTSGALRLMNDQAFTPQHGDRPDIHNVAIIMTDGQSNVNESGTVPEAIRSKNMSVRMFVVGLTNNTNTKELKAMSSFPLKNHFFNRSSYSLVQTVVSNLVWNVCQKTCTQEPCVETHSRCTPKKLVWNKEEGALIVGHNYSRLSDISTAEDCQQICLQDTLCKSIEFIARYSECSVSYHKRSDVPYSFKKDPEVAYFEWTCV